jgi:L-erythro-3,5-diaminohexanoate dehydrogenase
LDPNLPARPGELVVDCERLQVDSVSFRQLREEASDDLGRMAARIKEIVAQRGKLENPVTGSGGVLIGRAAATVRSRGVTKGDRIVSLVSLTLTPLYIHEVHEIHLTSHQVEISGHAILCEAYPFANAPDDLPLGVTLAALDVSSAPAQLGRLCRRGDSVLVLGGGGASGLLSLALARSVSRDGLIVAVDSNQDYLRELSSTGLADRVVEADATHPLDTVTAVRKRTGRIEYDLVLNVVNTPGTEMASVLLCRPRGIVMLFGMATSFSDAALSGDGIGRETRMMVGIGYVDGQADLAVRLLRRNPKVRQIFERRYA